MKRSRDPTSFFRLLTQSVLFVDLIPVSECAGEAAGALNPDLLDNMVNVFTILFP